MQFGLDQIALVTVSFALAFAFVSNASLGDTGPDGVFVEHSTPRRMWFGLVAGMVFSCPVLGVHKALVQRQTVRWSAVFAGSLPILLYAVLWCTGGLDALAIAMTVQLVATLWSCCALVVFAVERTANVAVELWCLVASITFSAYVVGDLLIVGPPTI